jgi:hypothetical protein
MTACDTNIVQIVESGTELGADQWVGWRIELTSDAVWLEAEDTSGHEVDIISPSSNNRVSLDRFAWNPGSCETLLKALPSLSESNFVLALLLESISNERVLAITIAISASFLLFGVSPIIVFANWTISSMESQLSECFSRVELVWVGCKLWFGQILDFLSGQAFYGCFFFCHL